MLLIVLLLSAFAVVVFLFGLTFFGFVDDVSIYFFHKPFYIHFYLRPKEISSEQENILVQQFKFYNQLSERHKVYFRHRMACFIKKYEYIPRDGVVINEEMVTLIAATYVMLTFGMRHYLLTSFDKIIIYPEAYLSTQSQEYYKGEFNPRMKAVVFSWKDFAEGHETSNDNLNLGIHEFSHVVHLHSLKNNDGSSLAFKKHHARLVKEVNHPANRQMLIDSDYFRIYAYTNHFEFISVIIEHYFETPQEFKSRFPQLFHNVSRMLNHKH